MSSTADRQPLDDAACHCWQFAAEHSSACGDCTDSDSGTAASSVAMDLFFAEHLRTMVPLSPLVDSHCHLQLFPSHRDAADCIRRAQTLGYVSHMVVCGVTPLDDDWARVEHLYREHASCVVPCFGLHPWWIAAYEDAGLSASDLDDALSAVLTRYEHAHVGECGLDKALIKSHGTAAAVSLDRQATYLHRHLRLAGHFQRSVTLHCVGCWGRLLSELQLALSPDAADQRQPQRPRPRLPTAVVLHSCNAMAADLVAAFRRLEATTAVPVYFSVSGKFLFSDHQRRLVQSLPLDRLLLETDSPDQLPAAVASAATAAIAAATGAAAGPAVTLTRNEPVVLRHILHDVAAIKAVDPIALAAVTTANARAAFHLPPAPATS